MDVFFCLLTGIWANICGVGGWGPVGGGGGELIVAYGTLFQNTVKFRK